MALNYVFIGFFGIAFLMALYKYFIEGVDIFSLLVQRTFYDAELGAEICLGFIGVFTLWMGIMKIGERGGAIRILSKIVAPFFNRIFPELPKNHPVFGSMIMNFSANMLGLDNAATPMGLKAIKELQDLNPNKERASNAQIMFLVLNTSGLTLILSQGLLVELFQNFASTLFPESTGFLVNKFISTI